MSKADTELFKNDPEEFIRKTETYFYNSVIQS